MSFLLDTNILSAHLRRPAALAHRFFQYSGRLYTSSVCLAELYVWAYGRVDPTPMLASIERLLEYEVSVIDFELDCAKRFGSVRIADRQTWGQLSARISPGPNDSAIGQPRKKPYIPLCSAASD